MTTSGTAYCQTITITVPQYDTQVLREHVERTCRILFETRVGVPPTVTEWRFERGYTHTDEKTGQMFILPDLWHFTCEGILPGAEDPS